MTWKRSERYRDAAHLPHGTEALKAHYDAYQHEGNTMEYIGALAGFTDAKAPADRVRAAKRLAWLTVSVEWHDSYLTGRLPDVVWVRGNIFLEGWEGTTDDLRVACEALEVEELPEPLRDVGAALVSGWSGTSTELRDACALAIHQGL